MDNADKLREATKGFGKNQTLILRSLYLSPQPVEQFSSVKDTVLNLQDRGLIKLEDNRVFLTSLGQAVCESWQEQKNDQSSRLLELDGEGTKELPKPNKLRQAKLEKSNQLLELYKQGFNRQQIGNQYGISRERVRQILNANPAFHEYLKECEEAEAAAEEEKKESAKQELYSRSLAALYPERVAELWDYERNGDLNPGEVSAGSSTPFFWLKCPVDGHSWKKKSNDITNSWDRYGTSGCPVCAGKKKKPEKQSTLMEGYPELVKQYWDYGKNSEINLDPEKLTLASNKKVWFKCTYDGNEWQASITATINQQWSKGNAGCRVCNGTAERKRGEWQRREPIAIEFPDEVAKYWLYKANNELELDPTKLTSGSSKEAFFKCPVDGHEWVASITSVARSAWQKGNSGCPACRGLIATETTSLIGLYPNYVAQYWDYGKNTSLGLNPDKLTRGSSQDAWFKCPIDGYEWKARITSITRASWSQGNSGCARCGSGWTIEAIRQFVASLEVHIPNLTQAELYKIFEQSGVLDTTNLEGLKIVKEIIKGKLAGQKLRDVIQGKGVKTSEPETDSVDVIKADTELQIVDTIPSLSISEESETFETTGASQEQLNELNELPKVKVRKSLEFLSSEIVASADQEAIDFFIASRRNRIWAEVFEDESAVEAIEAFTDDGYGRQVRDQFLDEYNQAHDMAIPSGWAFRVDGKVTPPNLMQKLAAVNLRNQQRMLNLSLTGTGKTIGGILSSRIIDAHLTIIICPLDTVPNWHGEIKHVFPDSRVTIKNFNPHWIDIEEGHHYILLNHEMFQQPSTPAHIRHLLERYQIDFIIVDEIHRCKQRGDDPSKRRQMVLALITNAAEKNPNLHVLGMSATPVINNLKEGKSLVELVTGVERPELNEKATLNNCMRLHQAFVTLGIRSRVKPKIRINRVRLPIDCTHLVDKIREEGTSILKMEQILTRARIPTILKELRPKTIVYTHYVEGIVDQLKEAIEADGWTVGFHMGGDKSGRNNFIDGSTDILIASSAMATGVDGFQRVCDRLILNIPPWTSAELEQLEGRLNRQGQVHDTLTILMPVTYGLDDGERWSWDEGRLARLQNKQTVADAAVDGVMPEGQLRTESQAFRDLRKWLERLKTGEQKLAIRPKIFVPLPDIDPSDVRRRNVQYGDFSRMNARWSNSYSHTTYKRLQGNPEEWMQYHTLYQDARKTWTVIPYEEAIKWLQKRSDLVVADLGCGEALIAKALVGKHTVHSFDFIAINDSVIECDMVRVPLEDGCLDVAMFNLSLMGLNIADYIREASRTLKLDGQLWIYEVTSRIKDLQGFVRGLETAGFRIIENTEVWKFRYIRAIKSEEVDISQIKVRL
ncbi:DEAD/DEAH box helicase family protein [Leptolyngbya sp. FACHB-541]|uniref:zinc-ribbon domain-containing protein n=1 Tax=Leptolyngbya sp. FACHB-541 TaxID=2692810 RepID=UPI0016839511|nr:zinc-ribbon domain-containing protein [Leptolyngbya sp. FACHB-541]MBD1995251.1 DEAD/DEAH box helicase family protein [Leptolyngbya sp. FACHB-541]